MLLPVPNVRGSNIFNSTTLAESDWGAVTSGLSAHHLWCLPASASHRSVSDWHLKIHKYQLHKYNISKYTNNSCRNKIPIYVSSSGNHTSIGVSCWHCWWFMVVWRCLKERGLPGRLEIKMRWKTDLQTSPVESNCTWFWIAKWDEKLIFKPHLLKAAVPSFILRGRPEWSNHPRPLIVIIYLII